MKKIFVGAGIILVIFLIYLTTIDKKVYYLALGDSLAVGVTPYNNVDYGYTDYVKDYLNGKRVLERFIKGFAASGYRTIDLINDINGNKKIFTGGKEVTIKNALIKADLVTISIGANDFLNRVDYSSLILLYNEEENQEYIDEIMDDVEKLLKLIREYCKEDIILVGYYNPLPRVITNTEKTDKVFGYANQKYQQLCDKYDIIFVDVYDIFKDNVDYLPNPTNIHPSKLGYKAIADAVIKQIDNSLLK